MKTTRLILFFIITGALSVPSCEPDKKMAVETGEVSNISVTTADVSGTVIDVGEGATQHGHCYGTSSNPATSGSKTTLGVAATGDFTSNLTGLEPSTTYHVRAYTSLGAEAAYGSEITFTTASEALPELTTTAISSITKTSAVTGGNITSEGGTPVTARGVCWNVASDPTISNNKTTDGSGSGSFASSITGLTANTVYYVRAYATNAGGTAYGNEVSFTTSPEVAVAPTVTTAEVTSITSNSAVSGGNVTNEGGAPVTAKGVCWSTTANPTITNSKTTDGTGSGSFVSNITNLNSGTTYHVRAYATNSAGTGYGDDISFTTVTGPPTVTTTAITNITSTTATSGGNVTSDGGAEVTARGVCWSTSSGPTVSDFKTSDATGTGTFISNMTGLTASTKYYVRAYATNNSGTSYGNELNFTTSVATSLPPTAAIAAATAVTNSNATLNGAVNANGNSTTVTFEYGPTTLYGSSIAAVQSPVTGDTPVNVNAQVTGLTPGTLYHYRVKAVNIGGTSASDDMTFTTSQIPVATTEPATFITTTAATLNGTVNATNLSTNVIFEYGLNISYGSTVVAVPNPITGVNTTSVTGAITGLTPGTTYHYRVKAVSSGGTTYGDDKSLTTLCNEPTAITGVATSVGSSSATLNGTVNANGFSTDVIFEYGTNSGYGSTATASPDIVTGNTNTAVSATITGLTSGVLYHYRVKATNCGGTAFGDDQTFIALNEALVKDTLLLCYSILHEFIEFEFLFDAVYSNNVPAPNSAWDAIYNHAQYTTDEKVLMLWSKAYDIIFKTNFVIINSTLIPDPTDRNLVIAQAKAIRAYLYYNLLIWFGELPLQQGATESMIGRSSVSEVLTMINQDADFAAQNLPSNWSAPDEFRINKYFAKSLLARTSLYENTSSSNAYAIVNSEEIVCCGLYSLSLDTTNFTSTHTEIIWGFDKSTSTEFSVFFTKGIYVPAFRYTETYLVEADARYSIGDQTAALDYLNALLVRRGLAPLPMLTSNEDIYKQWKMDLVKEGSIFITMKRYGKAKTVLGISDKQLLLPIPQSAVDKNPYIVQNPGY